MITHAPKTHRRECAWPLGPCICVGDHDPRTNIDDAIEIVSEIDRLRSVIRELKAAFARSELDGGVKAAPTHPLYRQCEARLEKLHEDLMLLI